jgi:hypothetical protein
MPKRLRASVDLTSWYLTLPAGAKGDPDTVLQSDLERSTSPHFQLDDAKDGVVFTADVDGVATQNNLGQIPDVLHPILGPDGDGHAPPRGVPRPDREWRQGGRVSAEMICPTPRTTRCCTCPATGPTSPARTSCSAAPCTTPCPQPPDHSRVTDARASLHRRGDGRQTRRAGAGGPADTHTRRPGDTPGPVVAPER